MFFHFSNISSIFWATKNIQIVKDHISLNFSRIFHSDMIRICIHAHDFLLQNIHIICQINAVIERLRHLSIAIQSRQTSSCFIFRINPFRFYQNICLISMVKGTDNLPGLLNHRFLIMSYWYKISFKSSNIRCLRNWIN